MVILIIQSMSILPFHLFESMKLTTSGNTNGWKAWSGTGWDARLTSESVWLQMWVELPNEESQTNLSFISQ